MLAQFKHFRQRIIKYLEEHTVTETSLRFRVSRKTIYKWMKRYDGTIKSLEDRSHRPHHLRKSHTDKEIKLIKRLMKKHKWRDVILAYQEMKERYGYTRSYDSFRKFVSRLKVKTIKKKKAKRKPKPYKRAEYIGQKVQKSEKIISIKF